MRPGGGHLDGEAGLGLPHDVGEIRRRLRLRNDADNRLAKTLERAALGLFELLEVVAPLTDPTAHGGSAQDAFDLVAVINKTGQVFLVSRDADAVADLAGAVKLPTVEFVPIPGFPTSCTAGAMTGNPHASPSASAMSSSAT